MSAKMKNMPLLVVLGMRSNIKTLKLINLCNLQKTSTETFAADMPVDDSDMHAQASVVDNTNINYGSVPPTAMHEEVILERNKAIAMYNKNASFIQGLARDAATNAGDISVGIDLAQRCGFRIKNVGIKPPRHFKANPGVECVDISTKSMGDRAGYIRQYGKTPAKGVPPTVFEDPVFSLEADIHIKNLASGSIYGFREAIILPVGRSSKKPPYADNENTKRASISAATSTHKAVYVNGAEHYIWSDWIYVVVL
jgi:hypothetical protein